MSIKIRERAGVAVMQAGQALGIGMVRIPFGVLRGKKWQFTSSIPSCAFGAYERHIATRLQGGLNAGAVFFDIGANVGYYTLFASTLVGDAGKVISFEPEPGNMQVLIEHITINKCINVTPVQKALADAPGIIRFDGTAHTMCKFSDDGNIEVECTTLDMFIQNSGISPDIMKIDVEGAEVRALHGADICLSEIRPEIVLSVHDNLLDECLDLLSEYDYNIEQLSPDDLYCVPLERGN
ncbi:MULTISPECIES: FkbM family methyltransferase [unclassified Methanoculleus]|uniref:FkbM family methyltransferase n=1 Tax=unclassified Methanoculleus TaxID=2619537 RepID=UPI0025DDB799|nr:MULTISPECIES: FkbM family methyltransferase [unclassified Methanoculleus]